MLGDIMRRMRPAVVLFCGDHSPYGWAHVEPVIEHFDTRLVVFASQSRWRVFRERLAAGAAGGAPEAGGWRAGLARRSSESREERIRRRRMRVLRARGIECLVVDDANHPDTVEQVRAHGAEVVLSAAYPQIFKPSLLTAAPRGAINFHPSLLPRFRGAHPHYWCIATGAVETGVTAHFMTEQLDDGPIVAQVQVPVDRATYGELYERLIAATGAVVAEVSDFLSAVGREALPQDESQATYFHNDGPEDHRLDFARLGVEDLVNRVRTGRSFMEVRGRPIRVTACEILTRSRHEEIAPPGTVCSVGRAEVVVVVRGGGHLRLRWQPPSPARAIVRWMLGRTVPTLKVGDVLSSSGGPP